MTPDWNVITRTIVPVIWIPSLGPGDTATDGIGDTLFTAFLSPANPGKWIWGAGPVVQLPTNTNAELGNKNWGLGPSAVVLHLDHGSPWVYGVLVNNVWSLSSDERGGSYNNGLIQPFVNYNFKAASTSPAHRSRRSTGRPIAANKWTVPVGGGVGKIFHLGKLPVNTQLVGLLQRRPARRRRQLADPVPGAVDVSEMTPGSSMRQQYSGNESNRKHFDSLCGSRCRCVAVAAVEVRSTHRRPIAAFVGLAFQLCSAQGSSHLRVSR